MLWMLLACAESKPAPRDLDALLHDAFAHYFAQDDDALVADVRELAGLIDEATLPQEGTVTDLTAATIADAGLDGPDPEPARGLFTVGFVDCTPEEMERILISQEQMTLYPENYLEYTRTYSSDRDAYDARDTHSLRWDTDYVVEIPVFATYRAQVLGGAHWTPDGDDGPYLFSTTAMPEPAVPEQENVLFDIDYQIEVFYPHDGGMVHAFGMWRRIEFGDLTTEDQGVVDLILGGLHGWDEDTTAICAEERVPTDR